MKVDIAGSKAAGEELAIGLKNKITARGCGAPGERCCDGAAVSECRIEGAIQVEAQQFEAIAVISKRDQLAVALKNGCVEISPLQYYDLSAVAEGLIQRPI